MHNDLQYQCLTKSIGLFLVVRGSCVECHMLFSLVSPTVSCSMMNKLILGCFWPLLVVLNNILTLRILRSAMSYPQNVFAPGPSFRISDSTWYHRTPLCHTWILNLDILQGSFRLCNWLSLWRLLSWNNHLPPVCWSTFRKLIFKQQLGCRLDIMDCKS